MSSLQLLEPRSEEALDLAATAWPFETCPDAFPFDDEEGRERPDREPLEQIGPLVLVDPIELEGPVVAPALEHLRQKPLDPATGARDR